MMDGLRAIAFEDQEIAARLGAYARATLSPSPAGRERARAAVMAEARARLSAAALATAARSSSAGVGAGARSARIGGWRPSFSWRRPAIGLAAASLAIVSLAGGTIAASPGGPLYGARVWAETLTLPSDAAARTDAEAVRLEARLTEAETASATGNGTAVQAALDAYRGILDDAMAAAGSDQTLQSKLELVLQRHLAVLEALAANPDFPAPAAAALKDVISRSEAKIQQIVQAHPSQNPGGQGGGAGNGPAATGKPGGNGQGNGNGQGTGPGASTQPRSNGQGNVGGQGTGPGASHQPAGGGKPPGASPGPGDKGHSSGAGDTSPSAASVPLTQSPQPSPKPHPTPKTEPSGR